MYIYVTLTKTPTVVGKVIRRVLDNKYNHMSISLTEDLSELYSFGRVSVKNFITGGPKHESFYTLSLGGENDVDISVFRIFVTRGQYERLTEFIRSVIYDVDGYVYNLADAVGTLFHRRIRVEKCYTCLEFCKDALEYAGVSVVSRIQNERTLDGMYRKLKEYMVYEGQFTKYPGVFLTMTEEDKRFMESRGFYTELKYTAKSFKKFIGRVYHTKFMG